MEKKRVVIPSKYLEQYFETLRRDYEDWDGATCPHGPHNAVMGWKMQFIEFPDGAKYQVKDLLNALAGQI
jgi:hypothetical protein